MKIFSKLITTLQKLYDKSCKDPDFDLFRIKDLLDSVSSGQWESKSWLAENLKKHITDNIDGIYVIGSWYGLMSYQLREIGIQQRIYNYDLDDVCIKISHLMRCHDNISNITGDGLEIFYNQEKNNERKIVICTACEHIDQDDLESFISMKHPEMIVCLQSNNMYDIDSHINCHDSVEHFISTLPDMNILYSGTKIIGDYERYMVIAK